MSRRILASILGALMVSLTACSSTISGTATSGGRPSSNPSTAPKVSHPLDASVFLAKPCTALTPADTAALGLPGAQTHDNSSDIARGCAFFVGEASLTISWETIDTNGLNAIYELKSTLAYWIPTTVQGYPAVEADSADTRSSHGSCVINVGVSNQLFFIASMDGANGAEAACSMAKQAAADVIKNLEKAQGSN